MLTKVGSMGRSGVQTIGKTLTLGGWTNILQNRTTNADTIRANTLGPFSSKNAANQVEIEQERLDINKQFIKLGITTTPDFFDLGTYAFFKENTPGQSPQFKAERMADHFNELWNGIKSSKETASDKNVVAEKEYYYNQSVAALKRMGILSGTDGNLSANPTFDIEKVSDKIKKAHDYGIKLLDKYTAAYAQSLNSYHGKDFVPIESYWPRSYEKEFTDKDPTVGGTVMPTLAGLGQFPGGVSGEVATRNKGRVAMPKAGGFYNLDGFQTLVNGLADIHSTINLSPDLAYVSALVNEGGLDAIIEKAMTRNSFKKFIISSIDGMLEESVMNAPDQNKARKLLGSIGQNVTSSILNNPTQYGKQPMSLIQAAAVNPAALGRAIALYNNPDPKVKAAVQKFLDQTTFSYTDRLAYIELENSIQTPSKASEVMDNIQGAVRKYSGGDALIQSNRMTQGVLLLSGYLNSKKGKIDIVSEAAKGFTDEDVAAGEQMAEMANAPADRHLLAQQLKDLKGAKKYLYYLQTFTFSGVSNFYNNIKIASSKGYSPAARSLALRNAVGFVGQQIAFQAMSEAIARILIAIAGPDEDEEEARRRLLLKMRAANITIDLATGLLPGFVGTVAKGLASTLFLMAEGEAEDIPETPKDEARVPVLKSFNKSDIPGAAGVMAGTVEKMYKAAEAEDKDAILIAALGAAAMVANQGTFKLLADKYVNHIIDVLNTTGSSEALKGFRHDNPDTYMAWVSDLRKQGLVSSDYSKFARKGILDNQIDYLDSKDATKFMKIYNDAYKDTYQKLAKGGLSTKDAVETSRSIALVLAQYNDNIHFKTITIKPE
jgi:hypothetical protein